MNHAKALSQGRKVGCWSTSERPGHEFLLIASAVKTCQQSGQGQIDKLWGPVRCSDSKPEVDEMNLYFPPSTKRKQSCDMSLAAYGPDTQRPLNVPCLFYESKPLLVPKVRPTLKGQSRSFRRLALSGLSKCTPPLYLSDISYATEESMRP